MISSLKHLRRNSIIAGVALVVLIIVAVYFYMSLKNKHEVVLAENAVLKDTLLASQADNEELVALAEEQQNIIDSFQGQIRNISSTVGDLTKLSQTDKELLRKYSKVYFLNENYIPKKLTQIDPRYSYHEGREVWVHADMWPHLKDLLEEAREDGVELFVSSAYRSFEDQAALKSGYKVTYGSGANQFSADQGYSEHQLGTTVDFATRTSGPASLAFERDAAFTWLNENAHRYGFVLSYPKGNSYYIFEPWHWRFVGEDLARDLKADSQNFYDLDQRTIDEYLIKLFD